MAPLNVEQIDALVAGAIDRVAERLAALGAAERAVSRRSFVDDLAETLGPDWVLGAERNELQERQADLLSLVSPLFGPNIALRDESVCNAGEDARMVALVEAGWAVGKRNFSHLLLDVLNIIEAYERPDFVAGYLVAAAPAGRWNEPDVCADWFAPEAGAVRQVSLVAYLTAGRSGWSGLGDEIHRRLQTLPHHIEFTAVAAAPFRMRERTGGMKRCSVRCLRAVLLREVSLDHS
jgi:hypothetical protein